VSAPPFASEAVPFLEFLPVPLLRCLAKGCLGKRSRVRYPLEPVWGLLGFFRDGRMAGGCDLSGLALQRWSWSLLFWAWPRVVTALDCV